MIALWEIGATDGTGKQNISHNYCVARALYQCHVAWRMAGTMKYIKGEIAHGNRIVVVQPLIWCEWGSWRDAKHLALLR